MTSKYSKYELLKIIISLLAISISLFTIKIMSTSSKFDFNTVNKEMNNITAIEYNSHGTATTKAIIDSIKQKNNYYLLENIKINGEQAKQKYQILSDKGIWYPVKQQAKIFNNVRIMTKKFNSKQELKTNSITVLPYKKLFSTKDNVTIIDGDSVITGTGMKANLSDFTFHINKKINGKIRLKRDT